MIGHPVGHSLSPAIHNAAFAALGLDWVYVACDVTPGAAPAALTGASALGIVGLSVTMPHKEAVAAALSIRSPSVDALGAANTVVFSSEGEPRGENTDAPGFLASLADIGPAADPTGRRCLVRGAGGAARAVVWALAGAGAAEVVVVPGRDRSRAAATAALGGSVTRVGTADEAVHMDIVVNATPLGLVPALPGALPGAPQPMPIDVGLLGPNHVVVDLVPRASTPWLEAAATRGAIVVDGLGMLVHQAALAFTMWTGEAAPLDVMRRAVARHPTGVAFPRQGMEK